MPNNEGVIKSEVCLITREDGITIKKGLDAK